MPTINETLRATVERAWASDVLRAWALHNAALVDTEKREPTALAIAAHGALCDLLRSLPAQGDTFTGADRRRFFMVVEGLLEMAYGD